MALRTDSMMALALRPSPWVELGLPKTSIAETMAALASGEMGVVAALSKYMLMRLGFCA